MLSMRRVFCAVILVAPLCAQQSLRSHLAPITAPIRRAGVYHVATGTWSRNASLANVTGPDVIYNNTCAAVYFARMNGLESFQHRSRLPSTSGPTTPSIFYGTSRNDEAPGCHDSYTVNGFQFAYCSSSTTTVDWTYDFASSYTLCGAGDMTSQYNVVITGLPGGGTTGNQECWQVDVDLSGNSGGGIVLSADGDGTYTPGGPSTGEQFGFSFQQTNQALSTYTGPILAGDFTWTGGPGTVVGPLTPCTGTDGTIWDNPINLFEAGTGMASNDFMRIAATPGPPQVPAGCYYFGGAPRADFWLKLYSDAQCSGKWWVPFCWPGEQGIHACTACSPANPPTSHGRGCNNWGQHTGGATLFMTGASRVSLDTIVFTSGYENNTSLSVLMQGTSTTNVVFGAGVRCLAGTLKRLYLGSAGSAANGDPPGAFHRPGPVDTRSVHQASLDVGYDIGAHAPVSLYYQVFYRDPNASSYCGGATLNSTVGGQLDWVP